MGKDDSRYSAELETALAAARRAAEISRRYYRGNFSVRTKADRTPVTQADVECEQAIREIILGRFPEHGFYGEETGISGTDGDFLWLVDPIDGTKGFVRQYPFFSTQIALMHAGEIVLGVSSGTMMDELAWAEKGRGAWLNGERLRVSDIASPEQAAVSTGNLRSLATGDGWRRLGEHPGSGGPDPGLRRLLPLSPAGSRQDRGRDRVGRQRPGHRGPVHHRARGGRCVHGSERPDTGLEVRSVLAANGALHAWYLERLRGSVD